MQSKHSRYSLLITHGWPGSIVEFYKVIDFISLRIMAGRRMMHLCHLSFARFWFFWKASILVDADRVASAWDLLMDRLGYDYFYAQEAIGAGVTISIGSESRAMSGDTSHCRQRPPRASRTNPSVVESRALERIENFERGSGYHKLQSTRPQTIGYERRIRPSDSLLGFLKNSMIGLTVSTRRMSSVVMS